MCRAAVVNKMLWICSACVPVCSLNILSSSLLETDTQVDLTNGRNASHRGPRPLCLLLSLLIILCRVDAPPHSIPRSLALSLPLSLTYSHLHHCHLPITLSLHFLSFFLSRGSFSTTASISKLLLRLLWTVADVFFCNLHACSCATQDPPWDISFKCVYGWMLAQWNFLLKSYCSHFSLYGCSPHIQAICQVTMIGAGTCKQDICIQEIGNITMCIPTRSHYERAKILLHRQKEETEKWAVLTRILIHSCTQERQPQKNDTYKTGLAPSQVLHIWTRTSQSKTFKQMTLDFLCSNWVTRRAAVWWVMMVLTETKVFLMNSSSRSTWVV